MRWLLSLMMVCGSLALMGESCDDNSGGDGGSGGGGSGGSGLDDGGVGGLGGGGSGGSAGSPGDCLPTMPCEAGVFGDMDCFELCESGSGCTIDLCDIGSEVSPACVGGYCVYQCTDGRVSCPPG